MKTKSINKLLITLFAAFMAFAILGVSTVKVNATVEVPTEIAMEMIPGAGIRIGTAEEVVGTELDNTNGIRFSAEIDVTDYEDLTKLGTVTAGTFVMPESYLKYSAINEETCFTGAIQKFTWDGKVVKEGTTNGTVKILHIPATPYETESKIYENKTIYKVNGAVVNMLDENLDRKYYGVSYLKLTVEGKDYYYFADTAVENSRSIVTVAQNFLILQDETCEEVATDYIEHYLDINNNSVSATVTEEIYVNSSNGYVKGDENVNSVTLTKVEDFVQTHGSIPEREGYLYITTKETETSSVARVDEDVKLQYFYDKIVDGALIFDSSLVTDDEGLLFAANGATSYGQGFHTHADWSWHGSLSILYNDYGADNYNFEFATAKVLPAPTNKISFMVKNHETKLHVGDHQNKVIVFMADGSRGTGYWTPSSVAGDEYKVTVTLDTEVSNVKKVAFSADDRHKGYEENPMWIDFVQAEYDLLALGVNNVEITETGDKTIEIDVIDKLVSTKLSDAEIKNGLTLTAKALPDGVATPITANNGKYVLAITEGTNYEIEYSVTVGNLSVSGKYFILGYINGWCESFEDEKGAVSSRAKLVSNSIDGSNALTTTATDSNGYANYVYANQIANTTVYTTLCFWAYSASDYTPKGVCIFVQDHETTIWYAENTTIKAGWNYYEMKIRNSGQMKRNIMSVGFAGWSIAPAGTVVIDRISLKP